MKANNHAVLHPYASCDRVRKSAARKCLHLQLVDHNFQLIATFITYSSVTQTS